eukprot:7205834-Prymnesium_polylepis.1
MYNAFGRHAAWRGMDPNTPKGGHTNLHCDVSDAVNVMLDVGIDDEEARAHHAHRAHRAPHAPHAPPTRPHVQP